MEKEKLNGILAGEGSGDGGDSQPLREKKVPKTVRKISSQVKENLESVYLSKQGS